MFVLEALVLTFITTPLTLLVYPPKYRTLHSNAKPKVDQESQPRPPLTLAPALADGIEAIIKKSRIAVMLHRLEHISPLMTMTQLLGPPAVRPSGSITAIDSISTPQTSKAAVEASLTPPKIIQSPGPTLDAIRLMDLSDRTSAVMYGSVTTELLHRDPLVAALRTFARLHRVPVTTTALSVIPQDEFPTKICERAEEVGADLVLLPWNTSLHPVVEVMLPAKHGEGTSYNPFDGVFSKGPNTNNTSSERSGAVGYAQFVRKVFAASSVDVALFLESDGSGAPSTDELDDEKKPLLSGHNIYFPYFGGPDDRLALDHVVQLCGNSDGALQATVVRLFTTEPPEVENPGSTSKVPIAEEIEAANMLTVQSAKSVSFAFIRY